MLQTAEKNEEKAQREVDEVLPRLRKAFRNNYYIIDDLHQLQSTLRNAYLRLSFM